MIPPILTIGLGALGFTAALVLFVWALCQVAADADEALSEHADQSCDELAPRRERRRGQARNGIGGVA